MVCRNLLSCDTLCLRILHCVYTEKDCCVQVALALSSVFELAHKYGDMLKVGWGNVIECLLKLNSLDLLAQSLEDDADCGEGLGVGAHQLD